jgi:hypothetical protein
MVTITGRHLDTGSSRSVTLAGVSCYILNVDEDEIVCKSEQANSTEQGLASVSIDNWSGSINGYEYKTNPSVRGIAPDFSFAAGGTEYVVLGENLDIVEEPRLLVHIRTNRRRRRQSEPSVIASQEVGPSLVTIFLVTLVLL